MRRRRKGSFWSRLDFGTQPTTNKFPSSNPCRTVAHVTGSSRAVRQSRQSLVVVAGSRNFQYPSPRPHDPTACTRGPCDWDPERSEPSRSRSRTDRSLAGRPQPTCCRRRGPGLRRSPTCRPAAGVPGLQRLDATCGGHAATLLSASWTGSTSTRRRPHPDPGRVPSRASGDGNGIRPPARMGPAARRLRLARVSAFFCVSLQEESYVVAVTCSTCPFFLLLTIATNKPGARARARRTALCCPSTMLFTVHSN